MMISVTTAAGWMTRSLGVSAFRRFSTVPSPDGNDILVAPIATPFNPGFMLVADVPFEATQISGRELWFLNYFPRVQPGGNPIGDLSLKIGGITVTADTTVNVGETACLGALFQPFAGCPTKTADLTTKVTPMQNVRMANASFDPTALVDVSVSIDLSSETRGSATLTTITVQFSEIPEPPPLLLLAGSLVSWAFCRSVKRKRETWLSRSQNSQSQ